MPDRLPRRITLPALRPLTLALQLACAGVLAAAPVLTPLAQAQQNNNAVRTYDIPSGSLTSALTRFIGESGVFLAGTGELTQGKNAAGLHGSYTVRQGLERLLAGTGLEAISQNDGTYTLRRAPASLPSGAAAAPLPAITVSAAAEAETAVGPGSGFVAHTTNAGNKTGSSVLETPQTVSVITRAQLDAQQATNLTQAARYIPGVYFGDNTDTRNEYFKARGFTLDQYQDGLKLLTQGAWIENKADPFFLDRIEVLEGPSSGLYGQSSPGGLVNLVSKRPTATPFGQIQLQTGTYGRVQAGVDIGGPVTQDGTLLYRLTALARDSGAQVDRMKEQRVAIAPALTWKPDANTSLTVLLSYLNDPNAGFWGSLPYLGTLLSNPALPGGKLSRSLNTGQPDFEEFKRERTSLGYEFEHRFNDVFTVRQNFRFSSVNSTYNSLQAYLFNTGTASLQRDNYMYQGQADTTSIDTQLQANFHTGALQHTGLIGVDYQYVSRHDFSRYGVAPNLNVLAPNYNVALTLPKINLNRDQSFQQFGVYFQDQIKLERVMLTLTGRQDSASGKAVNNLTGAVTRQNDSAFTGRAGLSYLADNGLTPYASYSTSFNPSTGSSFAGDSFKPTTGQQIEAGIKFQPRGGNALFTLAAFELTQQNVLTTDPLHNGFQVQTGEIQASGVELSAVGNLTDALRIQASYTHLNPKVTQDNAGLKGKIPSNVPSNTAKLWLDYSLQSGPLAGLSVGGGARYIGSAFADTRNVYTIPGIVLFDAALRYDLVRANPALKGWQLALNAANLTDKIYVSDCSDINCRWGQGRTAYATLDYRW